MRSASLAALSLAACVAASRAAADDAALLERIEELETRVRELESQAAGPGGGAPSDAPSRSLADRVHLGGSLEAGYFHTGRDAAFDASSFDVWDARFFVSAELGRDFRFEDTTIVRDIGLEFEWDLIRTGELMNDVGDLYLDFHRVLDSPWLSLQVGRFEIPVGEGYLRRGEGRRESPFITDPVGVPWFWDEGLRLYGGSEDGLFGYVASVSDGETAFNYDEGSGVQTTLKVFTNPTSWLHLSASALHSGRIGSSDGSASGALWLGESWARAFGAGSSVANFVDGVAVANGPGELPDTWLVGADAIASLPNVGHLWLGYGRYDIHSAGPSLYDRTLQYWIAELLLEGALLAPQLDPLYLGLRADGLGTYDRGEGYLLDYRYGGSLGYNMESLDAYSAVLGWRFGQGVVLRSQYTRQDIGLVRGVTPEIRGRARDADYFGVSVAAWF